MSTSATPGPATATPTAATSQFNSSSSHSSSGSTPTPKNFSPLVQQFLDYLRLEKHFSDYTVKSYGADLIQFGQFLSGEIGASHAGQPRPGNSSTRSRSRSSR